MRIVVDFVIVLAMFAALIAVLMVAERVNAQTQIAYCKTSKGEIITIAAGSPCPNGSWPL